MSAESEFVGNLKSVMIHLIKHDQPIYKEFAGVTDAMDGEEWSSYTPKQKKAAVQEVRGKLSLLEHYYEEYPHHWSRERYEDFKGTLEAYESELATS